MVNPKIKKDSDKVVDMVDIENIAEKAAFCRCWRSENVSNFFANFLFILPIAFDLKSTKFFLDLKSNNC